MILATGTTRRSSPVTRQSDVACVPSPVCASRWAPRRGPKGPRAPSARSGLTLLELVLVLVVVVAVLALAWPALDRPFANQRLRRGADQVRAALAHARNRAMREGVPYEFRFVPGGSAFQTRVYEALAESSSTAPAGASSTADLAENSAGSLAGSLPSDVYFAAANAPAPNAPAHGGASAAADVHTPQADGWSLPIVLFPDGTGTSATITLVSDAGRMIDLYLRGLSGTTRVSEPYAAGGGL